VRSAALISFSHRHNFTGQKKTLLSKANQQAK
jgi:hypothetical protein